MPSLQSKIVKIILRLTGRKKKVGRVREWVESGKPKTLNDRPSAKMRERHRVSTREINGRTIWTVAPREEASEKCVYYLHGGGYVNGFSKYHWNFISKLVSELRCTVVAPDYPLTPDHRVHEVFDLVFPLYQELLAAAGSSNLVVMGDSAGGGMGLALAMRARDEGIEQPSDVILLSPWLDVTMTNPEALDVDRFDPFLDLEGLRYLGEIYAGDTELTNYLVSPIYGSLQNLAPLTVFIGTHDLFVADCRKLEARAQAAGVEIDYHEYDSMIHVWMLISSPEAKKALRAIVDKCRMPPREKNKTAALSL
jgi:epsilon-lactone hydrolase